MDEGQDSPQGKFRYVRSSRLFENAHGKPLVFWNGQYWEYDERCYRLLGKPSYVQNLIDRWHQKVLPPTGLDVTSYTTGQLEARLQSRTMMEVNQGLPAIIGSDKSELYTVNMENGLVNLEPCLYGNAPTVTVHSANWFSTASLPYSYRKGATCPRWSAFLGDCLFHDEERIALLQEWYGYCCTFDTSLEAALFMEGPGGNGKTQALDVLRGMVGTHNCSAVTLDRLGRRFDPVATLGKLVNISPETEVGTRVPVATLRHLITGEEFQFEKKGVDTFTGKPTAKFVVSMNQRPRFLDSTNALWRRMLLMPWTYEVPKDKIVLDLGKKIAAEELPGIFNWAVAGLVRLRKQGHFTASRIVTAAVADLKAESDPIRKFLEERLQGAGPEAFAARSQLWVDLRYAAEKGEVEVGSDYTPTRFASDVRRVFPGIVEGRKRTERDSNPVFVWFGLQKKIS